MKKNEWLAVIVVYIFLIIIFCLNAKAQDVYNGCPLKGDNPRFYSADSFKNRYVEPKVYKKIELQEMLNTKYNYIFTPDQAVEVSGYVILVKDGDAETCNCHSKNKDNYDTHVEITLDENHTSQSDAVIVEITPRVRAQKKLQGIDWSTKAIRSQILHKKVTVKGLLFNDKEHRAMSLIDGSTLKNTHRATCAEVHPVFQIEILK
jgi:hypothetical protein